MLGGIALLKKLKQEGVYLLIAVIACIVLMKIAFYNESTVNVAGIVLSFFFVFVLPGFAILIYWHEIPSLVILIP